MELVLLWLVCGVFTAIVAATKGRSGLGWFCLGVLFGPFALLATIGLSRISAASIIQGAPGEVAPGVDPAWTATCGACRSPIHPEATICPQCRTAVADDWMSRIS